MEQPGPATSRCQRQRWRLDMSALQLHLSNQSHQPPTSRSAAAKVAGSNKELRTTRFCILKNSVAYVFKSSPVGINRSSVGALKAGNVFKEACRIAIH